MRPTDRRCTRPRRPRVRSMSAFRSLRWSSPAPNRSLADASNWLTRAKASSALRCAVRQTCIAAKMGSGAAAAAGTPIGNTAKAPIMPRRDRPPVGLRDSPARSVLGGCLVAGWIGSESDRPAGAAGVGTDVLRGGVLCTQSASVMELPFWLTEVRAESGSATFRSARF